MRLKFPVLLAALASTGAFASDPDLLEALEGGDRVTALKLLDAGADAQARGLDGTTTVMWAAYNGDVELVQRLIAAGADVNAAEMTRGQTAVMWAIAQHHPDVARVLLENGADVSARTKTGFTPLLFAAREGDIETARLLLGRSVDVNASSNDGVTPLLAATVRGHVPMALFFLEQGASADGNRAAGYTPLHWAATTLEHWPITYPGVPAPGVARPSRLQCPAYRSTSGSARTVSGPRPGAATLARNRSTAACSWASQSSPP